MASGLPAAVVPTPRQRGAGLMRRWPSGVRRVGRVGRVRRVAGPWVLPTAPVACGQARAAVRTALAGWGLDELTDTAELLVSELVSNALRHAADPIHLTVQHGQAVRCTVSDGSTAVPCVVSAGPYDDNGRGLALVDQLSLRWGCDRTAAGKSVWFELPERAGRSGETI